MSFWKGIYLGALVGNIIANIINSFDYIGWKKFGWFIFSFICINILFFMIYGIYRLIRYFYRKNKKIT